MKVFVIIMLVINHVFAQSIYPPTTAPRGYVHNEPEEEGDTPVTFESDIILTQSQLDKIEQLILTGDSVARKATANIVRRWPYKIIPYEITTSSENDRDVIMQAIHDWENNTCITFKPKSAAVAAYVQHDAYVSINFGSGCWSYIGKVGNGAQQLSIGEGCNKKGTIIHELGHAIGFFHEQSRPDRDNYIRILTENIRDGTEGNFQKYDWSAISTHAVQYDLASIMHYGPYYFSKNTKPTIVALNPLYQTLLGNRQGLTFADIKLANLIYDCNEGCDELDCLNDGYVGPDCTCLCKPGFKGEFCQEREPIDPGCVYELTNATGVIMSPNHPQRYNNDEECLYLIKGGEGSTITLQFSEFELERSTDCRYDFLEVRSDDVYTENTKYCGTNGPTEVTSVSNMMFVRFYADISVTRSGFRASWVINGAPLTTESMINETSTVSMSSAGSSMTPDRPTTLSLTSMATTRASTTQDESTTLSLTSGATTRGSITPDESTPLSRTSRATNRASTTPDGPTTMSPSSRATNGATTTPDQSTTLSLTSMTATRGPTTPDEPTTLFLTGRMTTDAGQVGCVGFGSWTAWSSCSVSCGDGGIMERSRICSDGPGCLDTESIMCSRAPCPSHGEWTEWSACVRVCDAGPRKRVRLRYCGGESEECAGDAIEFDESCPPPV